MDFRVVPHDEFGSLLQYFTGSKQHNINLRERAVRQGLSLSEYGITVVKTGQLEKFATEEAFYARLGLQYIPPEFREGTNEIALAEEKKVPEPIKLSDIKGDLHVHSDWSDGRDSIEEMALAARALGYRYIAITDHSKGLGIAHGLNEERIREQRAEIRRLNESLEDFRILAGIEVDIRADGSLDLPDEILAELGHRSGSSALRDGAGAGEDDEEDHPGDGEPQRGYHCPPHLPPPRGKGSHRPRHGGHLPRGGPDRHRPGDQRHAGPPGPQGYPHLPGQGAGREAVSWHGLLMPRSTCR